MRRFSILAIALSAACSQGGSAAPEASAAKTPSHPARFELGAAASQAQIAALDIDVSSTGAGLPAGQGTVAEGAAVYGQKCASCHGPKGEGAAALPGTPAMPKLVGRDPRDGFPFASDSKIAKTVGNYWPYATTLYDYVHRTMPISAPGSLQPNEVYAVVAWILAENEIIPRDAEMNATTLPAVKMPAAGKFVVDDRKGGRVFR
jgi:mono/diheme cytochrome c family protein